MKTKEYIPTPTEIDYYRENGYVYLQQVVSQEEIAGIRPAIENVVMETSARDDKQGRLDDYSRMFRQVTNVWKFDPRIAGFVFARKFARIAACLMEVKSVRLYHDQALFKLPGDEKTHWHQDMFYWPLATDKTVTMWMPLVDVNGRMGTMEFACGSHKGGLVNESPISEAAGDSLKNLIDRKGYGCRSHALRAGDATFHSGFTMHSAFPNRSGSTREVMTIIYYADGVDVVEKPSQYQEVDLKVFLPGAKPGGPAVSPLNPLLYSE